MNFNISYKRREVLAFILIAIAISLLVNLLSNIIYDEVHERSPMFLLLLVCAALITIFLLIFLLIFSVTEPQNITISFPLIFRWRENKFEDVPFCPASIHSRLMYERLSQEQKQSIQNNLVENGAQWNCSLHQFTDDFCQYLFLAVMFGVDDKCNNPRRKAICFEEIKGADTNPLFKIENQKFPDRKVAIPVWVRIETFKEKPAFINYLDAETLADRGRFIRLTSKYGFFEIRWSSTIGSGSSKYTKAIYFTRARNCDDVVQLEYKMAMSIKNNFTQMFSKGMEEHVSWLQRIEKRFKEFDWCSSGNELVLIGLKALYDRFYQ